MPVWSARFAYPRYVGSDRGELYEYKNVDRTIYPWNETKAMGYIKQVSSTYGYLDGSYPIINDQNLGMGESTCASKLVNVPLSAGGGAMFDISALMRVAMERTNNARDAIQLMGKLAVEHGYYGAEWEGFDARGEAGEALGVTDGRESWVFHIAPDGTNRSAVWAAQRVPDDHIAVVANQFVIRRVDLSRPDWFMGSANMEQVALRQGVWHRENGTLADGTFDFAAAFSVQYHATGFYSTRRVWRVYQLTAPGLQLPANSDPLGSDYPFSVRPEEKVSPQRIMSILRDHFEGTEFDLTRGLAAGPGGDPNRFDIGNNEAIGDGVGLATLRQVVVERSISCFRTSYSFIAQSRAHLPLPVAPVAWLGYGPPDAAVYFPLYPTSRSLHASLATGSLYKVDYASTFWAHVATANYANRVYKHSYDDIRALQRELEGAFAQQQARVEAEAVEMAAEGRAGERDAASHLQAFASSAAHAVHQRMWALFETMIAKYKDGYRLDNPHSETYAPTKLFYPLSWLQATGFFFNSPADACPCHDPCHCPESQRLPDALLDCPGGSSPVALTDAAAVVAPVPTVAAWGTEHRFPQAAEAELLQDAGASGVAEWMVLVLAVAGSVVGSALGRRLGANYQKRRDAFHSLSS